MSSKATLRCVPIAARWWSSGPGIWIRMEKSTSTRLATPCKAPSSGIRRNCMTKARGTTAPPDPGAARRPPRGLPAISTPCTATSSPTIGALPAKPSRPDLRRRWPPGPSGVSGRCLPPGGRTASNSTMASRTTTPIKPPPPASMCQSPMCSVLTTTSTGWSATGSARMAASMRINGMASPCPGCQAAASTGSPIRPTLRR